MIRAALAAAAVVGVGVIVLCPPRIEAQVLIMSMTVVGESPSLHTPAQR